MGKLLSKMLSGLGVPDEEDLDDYDDYDTMKKKPKTYQEADSFDEESVAGRKEVFKPASSSLRSSRQEHPYLEEEDSYTEPRRDRSQKTAPVRVVPLRSASVSKNSLEVSIMKPKRFEDSQDICDMLKNERATVVNLEGIEVSLAQRIMDFVSGAVYSLDGKIHQISNLIFIISPESVDISGDFLSYVEQDSFEVPTLSRSYDGR